MNKDKKILVVDDEPAICEVLSASLRDEHYIVETKYDGLSGFERLSTFRPHIILLDIWMPQGKMDGLQFLQKAKVLYPDIEFIIMSGHGTIETAVKATKLGAWDFVEKPLSIDKISILIKNIFSYQEEKKGKLSLLNKLRENIAIIGGSPEMMRIKQRIARIAPTNSWVLIQGEVGTGRRLIAQNIHYLSSKAIHPFIEVHCSKIPETLIEIELFGKDTRKNTEKAIKKGKCDYAQGGTLFLNEIGDLNLNSQLKLLNLLETQSFQREGGKTPIKADIRIIASTGKDLRNKVKHKLFNKTLFQYLSIVSFQIPPLRQRLSDLSLLINHFAEQFTQKMGEPIKNISPKDLEKMSSYSWPGNISELRNFVERIHILPPILHKTCFKLFEGSQNLR